MKTFIKVFRSELLKMKGTAVFWTAIILGALFPLLVFVIRATYADKALALFAGVKSDFWPRNFSSGLINQSGFFMPMFAIIAVSLVVQLEFKNNSWKQVFAAPISHLNLFFSKLLIIYLMVFLYLSTYLITLTISSYATAFFDSRYIFFKTNPQIFEVAWKVIMYLFYLSPIILIQYWLAMRFKNAFVAIGFGTIALIIGLFMLGFKWDYTYAFPFSGPVSYSSLMMKGSFDENAPYFNKYNISTVIWIVSILGLSFLDFMKRKER